VGTDRRARRDGVDADVHRPKVEGGVARQVALRRIRRRVGDHAQVLVVAGHRADVQHGAAAGLGDLRRCQLHEAEDREHVQLEGPLEVLDLHVEGLGPAAAALLTSTVSLPKHSTAVRSSSTRSFSFGDVAHGSVRLTAGLADRGGRLFGLRQLEVAYEDRRACGGESLRDAASDSGRRTGDDGHLALHAEVVQ